MEKTDPITDSLGRLTILLLRAYRFFLSPWLGNSCRFFPSCSNYSEEAIRRHGFWRGSLLTLKRLGKCHPWHAGGHDPVPDQAIKDD
jgi:putative membrane protein insertion efficiency factor